MHDLQSNNSTQHPDDFPDQESLRQTVDHIASSGALGRSKVYTKLLTYLLEHAQAGTKPKEIQIAMEVLGRSADFDVSKDSLVRVYVYQLRKKLDKYYQHFPDHCSYRLSIPKGQYAVAIITTGTAPETANATNSQTEPNNSSQSHTPVWAATLIAALLAMNLIYIYTQQRHIQIPPGIAAAAESSPWNALLDDQLPILIVMGDYYIFGELNEFGDVSRMIRDFNINSSQDLQELFLSEIDTRRQFRDLSLNYLPEGSAMALASIAPLLQQEGKRVNVTMMSKLSTADLKSNHIVYLGYISGLDKLRGLIFAGSKLQIGRTYDELFNRQSGEIYSSDAGLPMQNEPFRDYGLLSTFPGTGGNQIVAIAGTRDPGLMHTARAIATTDSLRQIQARLSAGNQVDAPSYEALFEVFGFDRLDFDANLVYTNPLDPGLIWSGESRGLGTR